MGDEKEEIRRLEKEIEVLERLIKNHGKQEQRIIPANRTKRLTAPVPTHNAALGNRYQWTKQDPAAECSSSTSDGTYGVKSSNLKRNYVMGNWSQEEQGVDTRQQECMHRNKHKSVYKIGSGQLTGDATQEVNVTHCSTKAVSNGCCVQSRTVRTAQKLQSVKNSQTTVNVVSSRFFDEKATAGTVGKLQHPVSSADSTVAKTSSDLVAMNVVSREAVVAKRVAGNDVKNIIAVPKHTVADELKKNAEQSSIASSVVGSNCLVNKAEALDSFGSIIKPSSNMNRRLCAINKYKLIRPADDKSLQEVATSLPHGSQFACKQVLSHRKKSPKSVTYFREKGRDVIHKSKYKLVKSLQESFNSNSNNTVFLGSQTAPFQLSQVYSSCGANEEQQGCLSPSGDGHTSANFSLGSTGTNGSEISPANRMHILSRYKLVKTSHMKHQQTSKENRKKRSRTRPFVHITKKKGWTSKYALKREFGEVSQTSNCINAILGRKVRNLSANKYKFINARPDSSQPSANSVQKRRILKIDRRKGARSSSQLRRLSWSNVPKSASSSQLNINQSKRKSSIARSLNRFESRRSLTGKRSSATKMLSCLQNPSTRYCIFYSRFGHCNNGDRCQYIHDPDKISVCTRFLRGTCKVTDCPFSHKVAKHKMPLCRFFLRRACNRDDCPYSHVNVARDAEICLEFLKGFCAEGDLCKKKHMLVCSDFSENGSCPRGKSCPMQHPKNLKAQWKLKSNGSPPKKLKLICKNIEQLNKEDDTTDAQPRSITSLHSDADDVNLPWKERRLPAYIALNNSPVNDDSLENNRGNPVNVPGCSAKLNIHPRIKMPSESTYEKIEAIIQQSSQES